MTSTGEQQSGGLLSHLGEAARGYAQARVSDGVKRAAARLGDVTESVNDKADNGGFTAPAISTALKKVREGDNPVKAAASGVGTGVKEKIKSAFGRSGSSGNKKFMSIIEDIRVGVPVNVAYDQWTQFQEFSTFMKGVESVDKTDEVNSNWRVKVFKSRRNWKGTLTEAIPDRRIAWTTDGAKGTTKGVVTFHPLADDLTQILVVMEYYPSGPVEKTGNLWRAPGRRARLDLKHYRRFLMQRSDEPEGWRGEIRDAEVVAEPGEAEGRGGPGEDEGQYEGPEDQFEEEPEEEGEEETAPAGNGRPPRGRPARAAQDEGEAEDEDEAYADEDEYDEGEYEDEEEPEEEPEEEDEGAGYEDEGYEEEEEEEEPEEQPRTRRREPARAGRR